MQSLKHQTSHNPYFSRWFSAIKNFTGLTKSEKTGHNPYFSRWFSAISKKLSLILLKLCHNPYFSRWFSAIGSSNISSASFILSQSLFQQMVFCNFKLSICICIIKQSQSLFQQMVFCNTIKYIRENSYISVTILILVDGFLQYITIFLCPSNKVCHNPYFSRWFSAMLKVLKLATSKYVTILILVDGFLQQPRKFLKISLFYAKNLYLVTISVNFTSPNLCI